MSETMFGLLEPAIQTLAVAFILSALLLLRYRPAVRSRSKPKAFPFLELPSELRNMVYEHLVEDEIKYPARRQQPQRKSIFQLMTRNGSPNARKNWIMLANRQVHQEFMDVLCKKTTFALHVDQHNHETPELWHMSDSTLKNIRKCELWFTTTSNMLGFDDPRFMPQEWPLCDRVCQKLQDCKHLKSISLHICALGEPLWNPLWVWFQASQTFKTAKNADFRSIRFSLRSNSESRVLGENHLAKGKDGVWTWECPEGHFICNDEPRWQPVRDFAASLFEPCDECHRMQNAEASARGDDL